MLQVSLKPYHGSDLQVSACTSAAASIHAKHHNSLAGVMHSLKCTSINLPPLAGVGDMTCMVQCGCKSGPLCAEMHCGDVLHSCTAHTHKALSMPHLSQLSNAHSQSVWYTPHTMTPAGYINRMQCTSIHMHNTYAQCTIQTSCLQCGVGPCVHCDEASSYGQVLLAAQRPNKLLQLHTRNRRPHCLIHQHANLLSCWPPNKIVCGSVCHPASYNVLPSWQRNAIQRRRLTAGPLPAHCLPTDLVIQQLPAHYRLPAC